MTKDNLRVALYSRVSGDRQEKEDTIASQLEAVTRRIASDDLECDSELRFVDDGYSGYILARPGLERLRDQAAAGAIDRLYMLDPDRLSRKYAYQVLILEELTRCGVEVVFLRNPPGHGPEENLLLQVQGMIAEYERAKIMERCRRGKQHAARRGSVNVLSGAPYGYRYVGKHEGGGEAFTRSWLKKLGLCGRFSSGSARNDAPSVRCVDASNATASPHGPGNRPGIVRRSGSCSRTLPTRERPLSARRAGRIQATTPPPATRPP